MKFRYDPLPHQIECFNKLKKYKVGALFMEMGTGKTRTMLEIISDKKARGKIEKVLWLCPCAARANIKKELEKQLLSGHEMFLICGIESLSNSNKLYSYLLKFLSQHDTIMVVDESLKIKNTFAIRSQRIYQLGQLCSYRFILNGTPISKDERDLFHQFYFLDYRILGYKSYYGFCHNHVRELEKGKADILNLNYLTTAISPYSFQKKLTDINGRQTYDKIYIEKYFDLSDEQSYIYDDAGYKLLNQLDEEVPSTIYRMFSCLSMITSGFKIEFDLTSSMIKTKLFNYKDNPRIQTLLGVVDRIKNEKIIIFTKYTEEIKDIILALEEIYGAENITEFHGNMTMKSKMQNIEKFQKKAKFLIANKTSLGFSWNLQFCHNVIFYNNDWDYATRQQAEDRVNRLGQEQMIRYIDIIANNTIEEQIKRCLNNKESLLRAIKRAINKNKDIDISEAVYLFREKSPFMNFKIEDITDESV